MPENKRIQYIDVAKFLAMFVVVFMHGYKDCVIVSFAHSFHVPLFFFLNGMTLKMDNVSFGDFLIKKLKGYIVPMVGLGLLYVLLDMLVLSIQNMPIAENYLLLGLWNSTNQFRFLTLWFLPALFWTDVILYGFFHMLKHNIWLTGLGVLGLLAFAIFYNKTYNRIMFWNLDAAFFGVLFSYFGYLFKSKQLSFLYNRLTGKRWLALILGLALMVATFFLSKYTRSHHFMHLDMFRNAYGPVYLTLPCALMGSLGFTLLCKSISNFVLAYPAKFNLAILAFHQGFAFSTFRLFVAKDWWLATWNLPALAPQSILFTLAITLYSLVVSATLYGVLLVTPLSVFLCKPRYPLFEKIVQRVRRQPAENS